MAEQLYINDERFGNETYVGTWEEWRKGMELNYREWYDEYKADLADKLRHMEIDKEDANPMEYEAWVEMTMEECLSEVDEEESSEYERLA